jgi:hypothetical protein
MKSVGPNLLLFFIYANPKVSQQETFYILPPHSTFHGKHDAQLTSAELNNDLQISG